LANKKKKIQLTGNATTRSTNGFGFDGGMPYVHVFQCMPEMLFGGMCGFKRVVLV
jgi:hypothetical protein